MSNNKKIHPTVEDSSKLLSEAIYNSTKSIGGGVLSHMSNAVSDFDFGRIDIKHSIDTVKSSLNAPTARTMTSESDRQNLVFTNNDSKQDTYSTPSQQSNVLHNVVAKDETKIIDEMKVQTMYKMIEEITIKTDLGHKVMKKLLYLTNEQALMFDEKAVSKLLEELDIGDPKFVIIFEPGVNVQSQMRISNPVQGGSIWEKFKRDGRYQSELNEYDSRITESQVINFMRNVLLPIAVETKAVILVQAENACFLSAAFALVAASEQARLGIHCPFKVIASVHLSDVYQKYKSHNDSISHQLLSESRAFKRREGIIEENLHVAWSKISRNPLKLCDIPSSASRVIVFENLDESDDPVDPKKASVSFSWGASAQLYNFIIKHLIKKVPSISISSFSTWGSDTMLDRLFNKTPVLLIDCRERAFSSQKFLTPDSQLSSDTKKPILGSNEVTTIDSVKVTPSKALKLNPPLDSRQTFVTSFSKETTSFPTVTKYDHMHDL